MSVQEYLDTEPLSEVKREYLDGVVVAMAGASDRHGLIVTGLAIALGPLARKAGCQLFIADMKVRVQALRGTYFYYPDLVLSCDAQDRESPYYRSRPCLVVEVTSPNTERIDRREKLFAYGSADLISLPTRGEGWGGEKRHESSVYLPLLTSPASGGGIFQCFPTNRCRGCGNI